jgi:hypothetical protein
MLPSAHPSPLPPAISSPARLPACSREEETNQTVIEGMGELHLEIIVDRLRREWKVECDVGAPQVGAGLPSTLLCSCFYAGGCYPPIVVDSGLHWCVPACLLGARPWPRQ